MTLRARLAVALAVLSAAAAITATGVAYATTAQRLSAQVDQSLDQAGALLASLPSEPVPSVRHRIRRPSERPLLAGQRSLGALGLVVIQFLNHSGHVFARTGQLRLPVLSRDRRLAAVGGRPWLRSVRVRTLTYRVLTEPLAYGAVQLARNDSEDQAILESLRWRFGLLDAGVVVLAGAAGWLIARRVTDPLRRLATTAEEVAATGRVDVPVEANAHDETGRLARAFATMLQALARARAQQHQLAQDAEHELRTPLTSMRTNVDILRRHDSLPKETREQVLGALDTELRELTGLVEELVELSGDHHDERSFGPVAVDQLASGVVERARQRSGRTITLLSAPSLVVGDARGLARAISNLVDNAVKFSPDSTPIEVFVGAGRVEVRDHGPGIAVEDLPRVFDRFYRSEEARGRAGSGLGLAIVNHVAELHGGRAFALNHAEGGAVIGFEIPVAPATPGSPPLGTGRERT
jgi:two-component system sensor histidine kinase MprB